MAPIINLGTEQTRSLSQVLSRHLSASSRGKQLIKEFNADRETGWKQLQAYLSDHLREDETLTDQLAALLDEGYRDEFTTIVASGGSVGEIINVGQLDQLDIRYYVFSDAWQVLLVMVGVLAVGGAVAIGIWWSRQPSRMDGDFNIAVAEFVQTGEEDPTAPIISQRIFSFLDGQYKQSSFEAVEVAHDKVGVITSGEEARALAEKINAHLVIYGDVTVLKEQVLITPQFYVVESHQTDVGEVNGEHKLGARIALEKGQLVNPSAEALEAMQQNTSILTEFTKALVFLAAGQPSDLELANESIEIAIELASGEGYEALEGKEVLYLFASDIARRQDRLEQAAVYVNQAKDLNTNYGRGYIAEANIHYERGNLFSAIETYAIAKELEDQPYGAYIREKASLGIGNSCIVQFQHVMRSDSDDQPAATELANCALENYALVVDSHGRQKRPEAVLREMAAWAYYGSAIAYQETGQNPAAKQVLEDALLLTEDTELARKARTRLENLQANSLINQMQAFANDLAARDPKSRQTESLPGVGTLIRMAAS